VSACGGHAPLKVKLRSRCCQGTRAMYARCSVFCCVTSKYQTRKSRNSARDSDATGSAAAMGPRRCLLRKKNISHSTERRVVLQKLTLFCAKRQRRQIDSLLRSVRVHFGNINPESPFVFRIIRNHSLCLTFSSTLHACLRSCGPLI